ncbi:sugar phosphate isomerase/epimerase family protein [Lapidilactobacillus mulanensis]|uniref:Sugar phosphate isomerase/epimerase family protein n=1 Tax=Lapidilactobacillus mulanensis TaxID=2485999 RepID=A0ABW4DS21_9LACO|nr:sugar phosphate isomerase/epimerase family protein [Lapidilactobacillus mulanensis]
MNCGIRAHDIQIVDNPDALVSRIEAMGFDYVQFAPKFSLAGLTDQGNNLNFGLANYTRQCFTDHDVSIAILGCYSNIIHPDLKIRQQNLERFIDYMSMASTFGVPLVATETGSVDDLFLPRAASYTPEAVDDVIEQVKYLVEQAEKIGCLVGIEPGVNHPIHDFATIQQLLDAIPSPNLKLIFDATNLVSSEKSDVVAILRTGIQQFGRKIYAFHLKDYVYNDNHIQTVPVGDGVIDLAAALQVIQELAPYSYQVWDEVSATNFERSIRRIQELEHEADQHLIRK